MPRASSRRATKTRWPSLSCWWCSSGVPRAFGGQGVKRLALFNPGILFLPVILLTSLAVPNNYYFTLLNIIGIHTILTLG